MARAATRAEVEEAARRVGANVSPDVRGIAAVDSAGRVRGAILYYDWTRSAVFAHVYTDTPMAWRALAPVAFAYPFGEGGRRVLFAHIRASNARSVRAVQHLGMREAARLKDGWDVGEDVVVFEMRAEWLAQQKAA